MEEIRSVNVPKYSIYNSVFSSRRSFIIGGVASLSLAALAGCGETETEKKPKLKSSSENPAFEENILGNKEATVTLIEYSSMTCPHCANFHKNALPELKKKYIETGKVKYIIREFPLDVYATAAFMLARCAGKDKYFPLVEVLYEQQSQWATENPVPKLLEISKQAGFTKESFEKCLSNKELEKNILKVRETGTKEYGVSSTPTFFINGEKFTKAHSFENFQQTIDPLLETKK